MLRKRRLHRAQCLARNLYGVVRRLLKAVEVEVWTGKQRFECNNAIAQQPFQELGLQAQ